MKPRIITIVAVISIFLFAPMNYGATRPAPEVGRPLAAFKLPAPTIPAERQYLGLSSTGPFTISQVQAPVVIIEIFSMYCPYCQREAPRLNDLYKKIESSPQYKNKIKILGIGAGNTPFEVNFFKKKFKVPFPLLPDKNFAAHKCLGEVRTPYFIVVSNSSSGVPKVIFSKLGKIKDLDKFLETITNKSTK